MSKFQSQENQAASLYYDDTGRAQKALKVQKLLDQAKRVIAREKKKEAKDQIRMMAAMQRKSLKQGGASMLGRGPPTAGSMGMTQGGFSMGGSVGGFGTTFNNSFQHALNEEEEARLQAKKIGPFSFDIDDEIDTEVLTNEQVYDDLKELEDILD